MHCINEIILSSFHIQSKLTIGRPTQSSSSLWIWPTGLRNVKFWGLHYEI